MFIMFSLSSRAISWIVARGLVEGLPAKLMLNPNLTSRGKLLRKIERYRGHVNGVEIIIMPVSQWRTAISAECSSHVR